MPQVNGRDLLTIEEISQEQGWPVPTIRDWIKRNKFCKSARIGRRRYVRRVDLDAWVNAKFDASEGGEAA